MREKTGDHVTKDLVYALDDSITDLGCNEKRAHAVKCY